MAIVPRVLRVGLAGLSIAISGIDLALRFALREDSPISAEHGHWVVWVGDSLRGDEAQPALLHIPFDVIGALWAGDHDAWRMVLEICEYHAENETCD